MWQICFSVLVWGNLLPAFDNCKIFLTSLVLTVLDTRASFLRRRSGNVTEVKWNYDDLLQPQLVSWTSICPLHYCVTSVFHSVDEILTEAVIAVSPKQWQCKPRWVFVCVCVCVSEAVTCKWLTLVKSALVVFIHREYEITQVAFQLCKNYLDNFDFFYPLDIGLYTAAHMSVRQFNSTKVLQKSQHMMVVQSFSKRLPFKLCLWLETPDSLHVNSRLLGKWVLWAKRKTFTAL